MAGDKTASTTGICVPSRHGGLDTLRVAATLLVVLLHAAIPYTLRPIPGLPWPTHDPQPSAVADALFWWIEGFIMPLFFTLSGFFAVPLLRRGNPREFLAQRARRLLLPLVCGGAIILPLDLYIWLCGWLIEGRVGTMILRSLKLKGAEADLWGLSHLWYLQYLFLYCAALALMTTIRTRARSGEEVIVPFTRFSRARWLPAVAALACSGILWLAPEVVIGFQHAFWPVPAKFAHGSVFFATGVVLALRPSLQEHCARHRISYVAGSVVVFAAVLPMIHRHLSHETGGAARLLLAGGLGLFAVTSVLGWFGWFQGRTRRRHPIVAYLAEASFWIYLAHHPLVGLIQIDLKGLPVPALARFALTATLATGLTLLLYQGLVRGTWLGALLNGPSRPQPVHTPEEETLPAEIRRAA